MSIDQQTNYTEDPVITSIDDVPETALEELSNGKGDDE